jgi:uncharacterized glyoxalase superfamily protein PhnB
MNERSERMAMESARAVMPMIAVDSVDDIDQFYTDKLGFTRVIGVAGDDGHLNTATLILGGARIRFTRASGEMDGTQPSSGKRPVEIYLEVADVDAYHAQLKERGVKFSDRLTLQWWGDKTFKVTDPYGYETWFYQTVGEPKPPEGAKIV